MRLHGCLFFCLALASAAQADLLRARTQADAVKDFADVEVQGLDGEGVSAAWTVRFPDGTVHPLALDRALGIRFGKAGEGRVYDLRISSAEGPKVHAAIRLLRYDGTNLYFRPESEASGSHPLPLARVIQIAAAGALAPTQPPQETVGMEGVAPVAAAAVAAPVAAAAAAQATNEDNERDGRRSRSSLRLMVKGIAVIGVLIGAVISWLLKMVVPPRQR